MYIYILPVRHLNIRYDPYIHKKSYDFPYPIKGNRHAFTSFQHVMLVSSPARVNTKLCVGDMFSPKEHIHIFCDKDIL